jgi:hypothetical protein
MSQYKKSKMYNWAQCAVLETTNLTTPTKLEILRLLMQDEDVALFTEEQEAKKECEDETV